MKLQVVLTLTFVAAIQALTVEQAKKLEKFSNECLKVSKAEASVIQQAQKGVYVDDAKLKVHALCMSQKIEMQDEKGDVREDVIRERLNEQIKDKAEVEKLIKLCLVQRKTAEDTALEDFLCFRKHMPEGVVLV